MGKRGTGKKSSRISARKVNHHQIAGLIREELKGGVFTLEGLGMALDKRFSMSLEDGVGRLAIAKALNELLAQKKLEPEFVVPDRGGALNLRFFMH